MNTKSNELIEIINDINCSWSNNCNVTTLIDSSNLDRIRILSPLANIICNIDCELISEGKVLRDLKGCYRLKEAYANSYSDIKTFEDILNFLGESVVNDIMDNESSRVEWKTFKICSHHSDNLDNIVTASNVGLKIAVKSIYIERGILLNECLDKIQIAKKTDSYIIKDALEILKAIEYNYKNKVTENNRDIYMNKEEYNFLKQIVISAEKKLERIENIDLYKKMFNILKTKNDYKIDSRICNGNSYIYYSCKIGDFQHIDAELDYISMYHTSNYGLNLRLNADDLTLREFCKDCFILEGNGIKILIHNKRNSSF